MQQAAATKTAVRRTGGVRISLTRIVIGCLVAAVGVGTVFFAPLFALFVLAVALLGVLEFDKLMQRMGLSLSVPIAMAGCVAYFILAYFGLLARFEPWLVTAVVLGAVLAALTSGVEGFAMRTGTTLFAVLYLGKMLSFFVLLREARGGFWLTLWVIVIIALTDIVGMVVGVRFGKTPLAPRLSPGKTWEGAAAAFVVATAVAILLGMTPPIAAPWWVSLIVGASASLGAAVGDLVESALKRNAQVKDSGNLIAGHGGVLDRFDSYIVGGVVAYAVLTAVGRI